MKTAVSIPDAVFYEADRYAKRSGMSRSRLYHDALGEYLTRHAPDEVTESMNSVVSRLGKSEDRFAKIAAKRALGRVEW